MKNILLGTGIFVLVLAMLTWAAPPGRAAEHGHVEFGHGAGVGSVHFAPHPAPVHAAPVVRAAEHVAGAVEHVGAEVAHAVYRNPYRADYFRRFPPGYRPFVINGAQYYGYYGLPVGYQLVVLNGITYYVVNGVYYQPYIYGGQTVYLVVPAPG